MDTNDDDEELDEDGDDEEVEVEVETLDSIWVNDVETDHGIK